MSVRIVQLGTARFDDEGVRIGTVRRPPRGVRKERYAEENWYDVWYPALAPSPELMAQGKDATTQKDWDVFARAFRAEMNEPVARQTLDLLAALSHTTQLSVGCYCDDEARCHRSVLKALLTERGAALTVDAVVPPIS
jgi:uncharacterized protein YeaO (DUF488 family)